MVAFSGSPNHAEELGVIPALRRDHPCKIDVLPDGDMYSQLHLFSVGFYNSERLQRKVILAPTPDSVHASYQSIIF